MQKTTGWERDVAAETDEGWAREGPTGNSCYRCRKYEKGIICFFLLVFLVLEVDDFQVKLAKKVSNCAVTSDKKYLILTMEVFFSFSHDILGVIIFLY